MRFAHLLGSILVVATIATNAVAAPPGHPMAGHGPTPRVETAVHTRGEARTESRRETPDHDRSSSRTVERVESHRIERESARRERARGDTTTPTERKTVAETTTAAVAVPRLAREPALVVYDWDGTLGDTYPHLRWIVSRAAADAGLAEPSPSAPGVDPYRSVVDGAGLEVMFRRLAPNGTHDQETRFMESFQVRTREAPISLVKLKPGIRAELERMKAEHPGVKLAILSSRPQAVVESFAREAGVSGLFEKIVGTGGSKIAEKPSPEGLHVIAKALGVSPRDGVMVGDTPMDVGAAKAAGMVAVALRDGMGEPAKLRDAAPDYLLDELPGFVERILPPPARPRASVSTSRTSFASSSP